MKKLITKLTIGFFLLAAVLLLEYFTDWDTDLQEYFFDRPHNRWLIYPELHKKLSVFFYKGIKTLLAVTALCCLARLALSIRQKQLRPDNKPYWIMLLSIIFVPALIAGAKYVTNVYCPYQLNIYNGLYPFVRILESYPADFIQPKPGRCFPAGHPTGAFALMSLYYVFQTPRRKRNGLLFGFFLGCIASGYQMLRGEHFLSHCLISFFLAAALLPLIYRLAGQVLRLAASLVRKSKSTFSAAE